MLRFRLLILVCLLATVPCVAVARNPPEVAARPYVASAYVIAPRQVGDFSLVRSNFDAGNRLAGVSLLYALKDHPEATINLYVYAAGRLDPETAVVEGMQAFGEGMKRAVTDGTYSSQRALAPAVPFLLTAADAPRPAAPGELDAAVLDAIAKADQVPGQKLRLELHRPGRDVPLRSSAYLFYKQLHFFKVRISAWAPEVAADTFDALADQAARALVPAVRVANVGGCANATLYVDPKAGDAQIAVALSRQLGLQQGYNCHASATEAGIDDRRGDAEVVEIPYYADDWTSQ